MQAPAPLQPDAGSGIANSGNPKPDLSLSVNTPDGPPPASSPADDAPTPQADDVQSSDGTADVVPAAYTPADDASITDTPAGDASATIAAPATIDAPSPPTGEGTPAPPPGVKPLEAPSSALNTNITGSTTSFVAAAALVWHFLG
mmetsp:Transcript_5233/g.11353  ORF Transcript_5233/g.11353 Transcript_5233/m.11353 type:complete len:145 (-) Transcript_5233:224-658(-)